MVEMVDGRLGDSVSFFDDQNLQRLQAEKAEMEAGELRRLEQAQREHDELLQFAIQGLREFPEAARRLGLQPTIKTTKTQHGFFGGRTVDTYGWALGWWSDDIGLSPCLLPSDRASEADISLLANEIAFRGKTESGVRGILEAALKGDAVRW